VGAVSQEGAIVSIRKRPAMRRLTDTLAEQALTSFRRSRLAVTHWDPPGLGIRICASRTGIFDTSSMQTIKINNNDSPNLISTIP
jgi:hypothetical protein